MEKGAYALNVPYTLGFMLSIISFKLLNQVPAECQVKSLEVDFIHSTYTNYFVQVIGTL